MSDVDQSIMFYQALTGTSFTLLGIWVAVMQSAHGGWGTDPARHETTLHITLKFFLPGVLGLVSLLGSTTGGGFVWRVAFLVGGLAGFVEAVRYLLRGTGSPVAVRRLALADPVLYLLVAVAALLPAGTLALAPLQTEGLATGTVFVTGLVGVWIALSERPVTAPQDLAAAAHGPADQEWRTEPWAFADLVPAPRVRTWRPPAPPSRRGSPGA
jgi:hypothetical protein